MPGFDDAGSEAPEPPGEPENGHASARRPTRGGRRTAARAEDTVPAEVAQPVSVNVGAWTDAELEIAQPATLTVSVSREAIDLPGGVAAGVAGIAEADPTRALIVMVIGRKNLKVTGKSTQSVAVPAAGQPAELFFGIEGTSLGDAQLDVIVRQTEAPLAKIVLRPTVAQEVRNGGRAAAAGMATPSAAPGPPRHQLYISEITDGAETRYRFHLELLRPGEPPEPVEADSNPLKGDKSADVSALYRRNEEM